ncbi:MAG: amidohydrolase family protein, partial [Oscillospiraceae bacterium]|nr:amidohydrolase family protein [Oscillospiraceae bacterium]
MKQNTFVLKGDLCYSAAPNRLETMPGGFWVVEDGRSAGVFRALPERYQSLPLLDWTGKLVIPGLVDLHLHAPQYALRGLGMDLELLEWLEQQVFQEESRYQDLEYARAAYTIFAQDLRRSPTTRACIFATAHTQATRLLMDCMEETGLVSYVGRVNMDRNCPDGLRERDAQTAAQDTLAWLDDTTGRY